MNIAVDLSIGWIQSYGIVFLMGSFSVAALSDLRRMSAQVEFVEIWALFFGIFMAIDIYYLWQTGNVMIVAKWVLVFMFVLVSNSSFGILFRVAKGDLFACLAMLILLPFFLGVIFILLLKICDIILRPILRHADSGASYPFIPVVLVASLVLFVAELFYLNKISYVWNTPFVFLN